MHADGAPPSSSSSPRAGNTSTTGRTLTLHTARKRSKASLAGLVPNSAGLLPGSSSDSGLARSGSGSVAASFHVLDAASASSSQQPAAAAMSVDGRLALPGGGGGAGNSRGLNNNNSSSSSRPPAWQIGGYSVDYALDWGLLLVAVMVLAAAEASVPRNSYIPKIQLRDTNYPLYPDSVPAWSVPVIAIVLPAVLHALHCVVLRRPTLEGHHLVLGLLNAVIFTAVTTNLLKIPVGRLRPDFNARCWPDGKVAWQSEDEFGGWPLCTGPPASVAEGRKSFPSGHSSWSAAGLCYLTWWLTDRLHPFDGSGHSWRLVASLAPSLAALAIGVSRYVDRWHHASDVAAGLLLGAFVSWLCYRQQRGRLAEIDPGTYGGGGYQGRVPPGEEASLPLLLQQQGPAGALLPV